MDYLVNNYSKIINLLLQHLLITCTALSIAIIIAFPIGIFTSSHNRFGKIITKILGIFYTIPSMAVFAMLIPFSGLGFKSAVITLVVYSQFILVRNILKGLKEVPSSLIDAGYAMGYNNIQLLLKIKLRTALPVILAGIRIATISIISLTTLAAFINAGGLGVLIFEGLYQQKPVKIIIGTILTGLLAIGCNFIIGAVEKKTKVKLE